MAERKLTNAETIQINRAVRHAIGLVEPPVGASGFGRASWHAKMSRLVADDYFRPYVHGGYEITLKGRMVADTILKSDGMDPPVADMVRADGRRGLVRECQHEDCPCRQGLAEREEAWRVALADWRGPFAEGAVR